MRPFVALCACSFVLAAAACGLNNDTIANDTTLSEPPNTGGRVSSSSGRAASSGDAAAASSSGVAPGDGGSSGALEAGPPPPPHCDPAAALGASVAVPGLPPGAAGATFTGDELQAFFIQSTGQAYEVFQATRADKAAPFGAAVDLGFPSFLPPYSGVTVADDGLKLYFTQFDEAGVRVVVSTRAAADAVFGAPVPFHDTAYSDVTARDGSARFFSTFSGAIMLYQQRPAAADPAMATPLIGNAFLSWYDAPSGVLWFTQYIANDNAPVYVPESQHWNGAAWDAAAVTDLLVSWSSPDACRVYGSDGTAVVMRSRPLPP